MTKRDIERMVSLADDQYIDELFEQKVRGRKRYPAVWLGTAAAAALALFAGGMLSGDDSGTLDGLQSITVETTTLSAVVPVGEVLPEAVSKENIPVDYDENFDYSVYFSRDDFEQVNEDCDFTDDYFDFDETYLESIIPFDVSEFPNVYGSVCVDENNVPLNIRLDFVDSYGEKVDSKYMNVVVNSKCFWFTFKGLEPVQRMGVDIYGCDLTDRSEKKTLGAYFVLDGKYYTLYMVNMTYEEAIGVIDRLILSGFSADSFDLSKGTEYRTDSRAVTLAEANEIEPFARYIPQVSKIGDMEFSERSEYTASFEGGEMKYHEVRVEYCYMDDYEIKRNIAAYYRKYDVEEYYESPASAVRLDALTRDNLDGIARFEIDGETSFYRFYISIEDFYILVVASCSPDELWSYISEINGGKYSEKEEMLKKEQESKQAAGILQSSKLLKYPVEGEISEPYGERTADGAEDFHNGIDFAVPEGTPVYAAADGVVQASVDPNSGYGKNIVISHDIDLSTLYAHLSEVSVSEGDEVKAGDLIGYSGSTGYTYGAALHFEVRVGGEHRDPMDYLV
ncbi:MAG: M23 family metallopeptidase [Oscillospiraceae bacterium]|nr:M23 family metallopeptidase [Oscillospiraceae bacterium]